MDKQEIINEYLLGKVGYRVLSKKYGVSRSAINRWVMDFQGRQRSKSRKFFPFGGCSLSYASPHQLLVQTGVWYLTNANN